MQLCNKKIYTPINIKNWILAFGAELISKSLTKNQFHIKEYEIKNPDVLYFHYQTTSVIAINSIEVNLARGQNQYEINEN